MDDESETPPPPPPERVPASVKDALYLQALRQAGRLVNTADAMLLQAMLSGGPLRAPGSRDDAKRHRGAREGIEAMLLDEEEETGRMPGSDDPAVRAFFQHQGMVLNCSRQAAEHRVETARILRDRLPATWAVFVSGGASERAVTVAADQVQGLRAEHLPAYDAKAAALVQEEIPSVLKRELAALRDALDPEAATNRHRSAANRRTVRARPTEDGMGVLEIHATAVKVAAMYDKVRRDAVVAHGREGECRDLGLLMSDRAADLILQAPGGTTEDPTWPFDSLEAQGITATILVTMTAETASGASDAPATVAGMGPIDAEAARHLVAHTTMWTRALIDPVDDTIIGFDRHERHIPAGLRKLIHLRMPTCAGDDCGLPSHRTDLDHAVRFEHDGRTRHLNLHPLCRFSHRMKDGGFFDVRIGPDGTPKWASKWGASRKARVAFKAKPAAVRIEWAEDAPF